MLIQLADGTDVHVKFEHGQRRNRPRRKERHPGRFTRCTVSFAGAQNHLVGEARCHTLLDNFDRRTGRRLSLARALAPLPRTIREEVWMAYFDRTMELV